MTLGEFLRVCSPGDFVGIYDMDTKFDQPRLKAERFQIIPTKQHYIKIGNLPYGRIARFLEYEVVHINHNEKGFFIRIHSQREKEEFKNWRLARSIYDEFEARKGGKPGCPHQ